MDDQGRYTPAEVKMLVAFHRHNDPREHAPTCYCPNCNAEIEHDEESKPFTVMCVVCGETFSFDDEDDFQAKMEVQPFAPCGCRWSNVR